MPHIYVPQPWEDDAVRPPDTTLRHLHKVLRLRDGSPVAYTDGAGRTGLGDLRESTIRRGDEHTLPAATPRILLAVAPPQAADRARFVVEKAAELAVAELRWLATRFGGSRTPRRDKAEAWAVGALEQSRGAHLMRIGEELRIGAATALDVDVTVVAERGGDPLRSIVAQDGPESVAILIGPEGGFGDGEVPASLPRVGLGDRILRVETAAIVAVGALRAR